jgi:hypothetical protein
MDSSRDSSISMAAISRAGVERQNYRAPENRIIF